MALLISDTLHVVFYLFKMVFCVFLQWCIEGECVADAAAPEAHRK